MDAQAPDFHPDSDRTRGRNVAWAGISERQESGPPSLSNVFASVPTAPKGPLWRKLLSFLGPGYLVAVGYMDPGNWATSLAGGARFGYALLAVALLANVM